jgi:hypothetical protein
VLPLLIALLGAAALTPILTVFLGESFGLSGGRQAPWTWSLAFVGLLGFWSARAVGSRGFSPAVSSSILIVLGLVTIGLWWALEPVYRLGPVLRNPVSLVQENGYLIVPLLIGIGVWYQGLRYDFDPGLFSPEEVRGNVQRSWALLAISIVLAAITGGDAGESGIRAAALAVPIAMACSAGAVAAAEVDNTRWLAQRRGSSAPGWDRWTRLFAGIVVVSLVVTGIAALLLGPEALALVMDGLRIAFLAIGTVVYWIAFAVVYVIYWIYRSLAWLLNGIFGDMLPAVEMPQMEQQQQEQQALPEPGEPEPFPYASRRSSFSGWAGPPGDPSVKAIRRRSARASSRRASLGNSCVTSFDASRSRSVHASWIWTSRRDPSANPCSICRCSPPVSAWGATLTRRRPTSRAGCRRSGRMLPISWESWANATNTFAMVKPRMTGRPWLMPGVVSGIRASMCLFRRNQRRRRGSRPAVWTGRSGRLRCRCRSR